MNTTRSINAVNIVSSYLNKKDEDKTLGIHLEACAAIGNNSAKLVVGSTTQLSLGAVKEFVFATTGYKLIPYSDSYVPFKQEEDGLYKASIIAFRSKRVEEEAGSKKNMTQISANSYLDQEVGDVWEKEDIDGSPHFVKKNLENIEKILEDVAYTSASTTIRAKSDINEFVPVFASGDWVEFFTLNKDTRPGKAIGLVAGTKIDNNNIIEVIVGSAKASIPRFAVSRVVAGNEVTNVEDVISFLKKMYPADYSKIIDSMNK